MHRFLVGTCQMHLRLTPRGAWMVRGQVDAERFKDHRGRPNQREVLYPLLDAQQRPLLPASSLKGVLRSTAERILRSMQPERDSARVPLADDPFVHAGAMSPEAYQQWLIHQPRGAIADSELVEWNMQHNRYTSELTPDQLYTLLSPASQLFGATLHAGLVHLEDARAPTSSTWRRSHVAIDRFTGGVGEGPFIEELGTAATPLETRLTISNFALWQLALFALVFQELCRGYAAVGGGTRKGQGQVDVQVTQMELCYVEPAYAPGQTGIISAQARLADPPWGVRDVPPAVYAVERPLTLLTDLQPVAPTDWRDHGTTRLAVPTERIPELFRATVRQAWQPWITRIIEETA